MSDLLEAILPFSFNGKVYQVAPRDLFIEKHFSLWVQSEAALALDRLRNSVPPRFYREQSDIYNSKIVGKLFDWGRTDCYNASTSEEGEAQLLYLKMKRGEARGGAFLEREDIDKIKKDKEKWNELLTILYQQDYPEQLADFLQLIGKKPEGEESNVSTKQSSKTIESQSADGIPNNTGNIKDQPQSSQEKVSA